MAAAPIAEITRFSVPNVVVITGFMGNEAMRGGFVDRVTEVNDKVQSDGYYLSVMQQSTVPRYIHSIGGKDLLGFEIILAGAILFLLDDALFIIRQAINRCLNVADPSTLRINLGSFGSFNFARVDQSWTETLFTDAIEYFGDCNFDAFQLLPDTSHTSIDVPRLDIAVAVGREPVWRWLREPWQFQIPEASTAVTNFDALRGYPVTEASRWEPDEWDLFAGSGPDTPDREVRVVPIGTLLAVDETLHPVISLDVGQSLWRDEKGGIWNDWGLR